LATEIDTVMIQFRDNHKKCNCVIWIGDVLGD
jgi:hypothetical protein